MLRHNWGSQGYIANLPTISFSHLKTGLKFTNSSLFVHSLFTFFVLICMKIF
nr:MAG TPA: hypothetical protein [Caudoviricetes sp.]